MIILVKYNVFSYLSKLFFQKKISYQNYYFLTQNKNKVYMLIYL